MALFAILFGTRHIDATEHHEGMVAAIAFESVVKLVAFTSVGLFVTYGLFDGFADLFRQAAADPRLAELQSAEVAGGQWLPLTFLAMLTVICLPRQFQVIVVENTDESHLKKAIWLFPLYLLLINIFVLPIALGGLLRFPLGTVDADTFVLVLPMAEQQPYLALFAFIGGLSAATGMVIVETVALSTMICNDLVMPVVLRSNWMRLAEHRDLSGLLLAIRRTAIAVIMLFGYLYFRLIGESFALASIGLVSFAAAAQFAPAILLGIYWKAASRRGALCGMIAGFAVWAYTLLLPSFAQSGWIDQSFIDAGPFAIELLKPYALFGLGGLDPITHSLFWSLLANVGAFVAVSLSDRPSTIERIQATLFVEVFRQGSVEPAGLWQGAVPVSDLRAMAERFLGRDRTQEIFAEYARSHRVDLAHSTHADGDLVQYVERRLSGVIGAASARVMVATTLKGEGVGLDEIMQILDETSQVLEYSRQLEQKSRELERATNDLKAANERLTELDRMKDDFLSTVTHELRTPLTSIRSFSEILHDSPDLDLTERQHFLTIIIRESERLTRLINQVLDLTKIETGRMKWQMTDVDLVDVIDHAVSALRHLFEEKSIALEVHGPARVPPIRGDRDQLIQLVINLLSNAEKFCPPGTGRVDVSLQTGARRGDRQRRRQRPRHPGQRAGADLREVPPGPQRQHRQPDGLGAGPRHLPGDRRAPGRADLGAQHARKGRHLLLYRPLRPQRRRDRCGAVGGRRGRGVAPGSPRVVSVVVGRVQGADHPLDDRRGEGVHVLVQPFLGCVPVRRRRVLQRADDLVLAHHAALDQGDGQQFAYGQRGTGDGVIDPSLRVAHNSTSQIVIPAVTVVTSAAGDVK